MQVVITLAGLGRRFSQEGYETPKPFIQLADEETVIEKLLYIFPKNWKLFFVVNDNLPERYIRFLSELRLKSEIIRTPYSERGPVDTVLAAIPHLDEKDSVLVSYCDYSLNWDPMVFLVTMKKNKCDAAIVGYQGFHPTYLGPNTYCHYKVKNKKVLDIKEKSLFTGQLEKEWTSCGLYYFKNPQILQKGLDLQLKYKLCRGEYYTSLAIKALMQVSKKTKVINYPIDHFVQLGTPFDIQMYNYWYELFYQ